jgi:ATP-dependent Clp protease ATP-binding subunit ClpA
MYGARPLRRVITSRIEDQLSEELLRGRISRGDTVVVDVSPGVGLTFHAEPRRKETASEDSRPPNSAPA